MNKFSQEQFQRIVGQRVKLAREDANLSQGELACQLGSGAVPDEGSTIYWRVM
jgi:transcriptional regulator with XRE-family HTH domain